MDKNIVVIILGNRLNDDGTISQIQRERLELALEIERLFNPKYYILSGGLANKKALITEAEAMYNNLLTMGMNKDKMILEKNSLTTVENAKFSVPLAKQLGADIIIVCSSGYHFADSQYMTMELFVKEARDREIALMIYTK